MPKYLFLIGTALAVSTPAWADEAPADIATADAVRDTLITVTATGSKSRVDLSGQPISIIGADEIDSVQGPDVTRLLERLPGVTFARNGGMGSATSLFVRGANSQQLLVMVDGIRTADASLDAGGYDFGNLSAGGLGKIELLRGSNSVVWGADAIGGVIALTSRDVNGVDASAEYGARESYDAQVNAGVTGDRYAFNVNGGYTRTDGTSQAASGTEADGFRQWRGGARARFDLTDTLSVRAVGRYTEGRLELDGFAPPTHAFGDTAEYQKSREWGGLGGLRYDDGTLSLDASYQLSDTKRRYFDPSIMDDATSVYEGRTQRAQLFGSYNYTNEIRLDFGGDQEWSRIGVESALYGTSIHAKADLSSGHALIGYYSDAATLAAGVRYDDHSRFGGAWTFGANGSVRIVGALRARASYGEGFKAPSLYQLFSKYGNPALNPEKSRSYDAGLEWGDRNGPLFASVTAFRRDTRNLINYVSCFSVANDLCDDGRFGFYDNIGKARATGVELELGAQVSPNLRAQATYTFVRAENRTRGDVNFGNDLARRPNNAITVSVDWTTPVGLVLGGDIRMVSDSFDNASNTTQLDGYALATLRASLPIGDRFEVFGRVENLTDANYEVAGGYAAAGRSAYAGVRVKM